MVGHPDPCRYENRVANPEGPKAAWVIRLSDNEQLKQGHIDIVNRLTNGRGLKGSPLRVSACLLSATYMSSSQVFQRPTGR